MKKIMRIFVACLVVVFVLSARVPAAKAFQPPPWSVLLSGDLIITASSETATTATTSSSSSRLYSSLFQQNSVNVAMSNAPPKIKNVVGSIEDHHSSTTTKVEDDQKDIINNVSTAEGRGNSRKKTIRVKKTATTTTISSPPPLVEKPVVVEQPYTGPHNRITTKKSRASPPTTTTTTMFVHNQRQQQQQSEKEVQVVAGVAIAKSLLTGKPKQVAAAKETMQTEIASNPKSLEEEEEGETDVVSSMSSPQTILEEQLEQEKEKEENQPQSAETVQLEAGIDESSSSTLRYIHPAGLALDDFTKQDAETIQQATQRLRLQYPNLNSDLLSLLFWIQNGQSSEAIVALQQLLTILENETSSSIQEEELKQTTAILYRIGGHIDIGRTILFYSDDETLQHIGMQVMNQMSCNRRAKTIQFEEINNFQKSLAAIGILDVAFAAMEQFPNNVALATTSLSVLNNLIPAFTLDQLLSNEMDLITKTMTAMKDKYPEDPSVLCIGCDILCRVASMSSNNNSTNNNDNASSSTTIAAARAKLDQVDAISFLSNLMKRFNGKEERVAIKSEMALIAILMMGQKDDS